MAPEGAAPIGVGSSEKKDGCCPSEADDAAVGVVTPVIQAAPPTNWKLKRCCRQLVQRPRKLLRGQFRRRLHGDVDGDRVLATPSALRAYRSVRSCACVRCGHVHKRAR